MVADSLAKNTPKFIPAICSIGPKVLDIIGKRLHPRSEPTNYQSVTPLYTLLGPALQLLIHIRISPHCEIEKQSLLKKFSLKIPIASSDSVPEIALCLFNLISSTWSPLAFWAWCLLNPIAGVLNTEFGGAWYFLVDIVLLTSNFTLYLHFVLNLVDSLWMKSF